MSSKKLFGILAVAGLAALSLTAGVRKQPPNKLSPEASTTIKIGGVNVTVEYSAPSARGRKVEGGLIPYDHIWRAGADSATTLINDGDIMIGDLRVPKGMHTLYVAASDGDWKLAVNNQTGQWGTEYSKDQDLGRTSLTLKKTDAPVETFKMNLTKNGANSAMLWLMWGNTSASVPVTVAK